MNYNVIATPKFKREIKRLTKKFVSLKNEYASLIDELSENPILGTLLGNNCYKIRLPIASKGKGKSGGARVITYVFVEQTTVYLISIYDKSEQSSITDKELLRLVNEVS
jgi:mRNA-degrading endonuclease RelE of RelBE toxin-antitoxin system